MQLSPEQHKLSAVVLAGDRSKSDTLARQSRSGCKALIEINGQPMLHRVLQALQASQVVQSITLAGPERQQAADDAALDRMIEQGEIHWRPPQPTPSTSAYDAMQTLAPTEPVLLTTADHPLLTPAIVNAFGRQSLADDIDVAVGLAPHALVLDAYPGIRKTVLRFSDGEFCGCNLFAFLTPEGRSVAGFWRRIEHQRKKPLRLIGLLGWWALIRYRLGLLSLEEALTMLGKRLGVRIRAVILPYADAAIDVDSIADLDLVNDSLSRKSIEQPG
jgi:GTP:adenosylcobinamide-phosphate guanylyltransferase